MTLAAGGVQSGVQYTFTFIPTMALGLNSVTCYRFFDASLRCTFHLHLDFFSHIKSRPPSSSLPLSSNLSSIPFLVSHHALRISSNTSNHLLRSKYPNIINNASQEGH